MNPNESSTKEVDLERLLASRPGPEPDARFRSRVLSAVAAEIAQPRRERRDWRPAWKAAAAIALALNLGMAAANGFRIERLQAVTTDGPVARAGQNEPLPEPARIDDDLLRYAVHTLFTLPPTTDMGAVARNCLKSLEDERWDSR